MLPIHNGTFDLALYAREEPFERQRDRSGARRALPTPALAERPRLDANGCTNRRRVKRPMLGVACSIRTARKPHELRDTALAASTISGARAQPQMSLVPAGWVNRSYR